MLTSNTLGFLALCGIGSAATFAIRDSNSSTATGVECACNKLHKTFPELTILPNSTDYERERTNIWDKRASQHPSCIFLPSTAEETARGVSIFHTCDAPFAIRGGGHMNIPGSNNIDNGVLLALNSLNHLQVVKDDQSIEVGPGNRWVDVYNELAPSGRYTVGGRLKAIGVPGLTLIGGVNYFLNKYGFTMDNVLSYDVILGNGTQVVASKTSHPDLFWALKGGVNNYGIVTKFTFKTFDIPKVTSTFQIFDEPAMEQFITAICDMIHADDGAVGAGAVFNIVYNSTAERVSAQMFGLQEGVEMPPSRFSHFADIPALRRADNVTEPATWHSQFETPNQMFRIQFGHHTMEPDAAQIYRLYQIWRDAIEDIADVEGIAPGFVLNAAPRSAVTVSKTNGVGNTFGLDDETSYVYVQLTTSWDNEKDDLRVSAWSQSLLAQFHRLNKEEGLATEFIYMGDAGEFQSPWLGYGEENYARMRSIRDIYDPDLVFTRLNWGGFKLGY